MREERLAAWKPKENKAATKDPYSTLFVSRLNYEVTGALPLLLFGGVDITSGSALA